MADPGIFGIETADGDGRAVFEAFIPDVGQKEIGYLQAVDSSNCTTASLRVVDWTP